jgi:ABC-type multidrug transport system fused ATPase/permease subunit
MIRGAAFTAMYIVPVLITAQVSTSRLQEFLNDVSATAPRDRISDTCTDWSNMQTELLDRYTANAKVHGASAGHQNDLGLANASFSWAKESSLCSDASGTSTPRPAFRAGRGIFRLHINSEIAFKRGSINLIVGPTGSGKTSMLMALLGEMHYVPNGPSSWVNLPRTEGVGYCAQVSWVQNLTIRENILFGAPFDEARYKKGMSWDHKVHV